MVITICISFRIDLDLEIHPESAQNYHVNCDIYSGAVD